MERELYVKGLSAKGKSMRGIESWIGAAFISMGSQQGCREH